MCFADFVPFLLILFHVVTFFYYFIEVITKGNKLNEMNRDAIENLVFFRKMKEKSNY
jgi:hypothetical protein